MKKLWIATELFYPEETSTSYILTKVANKLSEKYKVEVFCGEPSYDKNKNPEHSLSGSVIVNRLKSGTADKNSLASRSWKFVSLSLMIFFRLLFQVKKDDKVFIVTNPAPLVLLIALLKKTKRFELIILVHDVFPENTIPAGIIKKKNSVVYMVLTWFFNRAYATADQLIVLGRDMKKILSDKVNTYGNPTINIIENWGETESIYPVSKEDVADGDIDFTKNIVFQYAGNMGRVQGLQELLGIIQHLDNKELFFYFVGEGAVKREMQEFVQKNSLENVRFGGAYKRIEQNNVLNLCDVAIVTLAEGMYGLGVPSKTYNILAAGKPILFIGDPESEIGQLIAENEIGFVFRPDQKKELIAFFNAFDPVKEKIKEKSLRARNLAVSNFSIEVIMSKFKESI